MGLIDIRDATTSMSELRATAKLLRERVKNTVADRTSKRVEGDASTDGFLEIFWQLPFGAKFGAFAGDAVLLRFAIGAALLGAIAALAVLDESFTAFRCRFVCAR